MSIAEEKRIYALLSLVVINRVERNMKFRGMNFQEIILRNNPTDDINQAQWARSHPFLSHLSSEQEFRKTSP